MADNMKGIEFEILIAGVIVVLIVLILIFMLVPILDLSFVELA